MNAPTRIERRNSTCPHDCPSVCALDVEVLGPDRIGRIRGAEKQTYTAGVVCAKVARYAQRVHHPDRLLHPLKRVGPKGSGQFERISWDEALDTIAAKFLEAERQHGAESVWPYYYAGTMGRVMRDGINRLTHAKKYSRFYSTICVNLAWPGYIAGTGRLAGPDPREMAKSDCVVIWGTNAVATQVNVMTHATRARKERGAKIVVVDVYRNATMEQADLALCLRPGTDGALACAVMHVLFREGFADRDFMTKYTDAPDELETHLQTRTPEWASSITGLSVAEIEEFARLVGRTKRTFFRLGYGFSRQRNGAVNMHAASCIAGVTGAWAHEGGGAFHNNGAIYNLKQMVIEGQDVIDRSVRILDQSRIGAILTGEAEALHHGPPVTAMLIQNTNPVNVMPEQRLVRQGFARDDLFVAVHEQFMTETAEIADIVLPATMFVEHDDIYRGGGQSHVLLGPKLVEPPEDVRPNLFVIEELAKRLGVAGMPGFGLTARQHIDAILAPLDATYDDLLSDKWIDRQPDFETAHFLKGFGHPDGRFRFRPDWRGQQSPTRPPESMGLLGPHETLPGFPDYWPSVEEADAAHPYRLATPPARNYLNSSFSETRTSREKEGRPELMISPADAGREGVASGDIVTIGNARGSVRIHARVTDLTRPGVLVAEGVWPNRAHLDGEGINTLTSAQAAAPYGGVGLHDNHVWLRNNRA